MSEVVRSLVLGVVQGLAEFLPISSSGHLRIIQEAAGWNEFGLAFDTLLHVGTLFAVVVYFRADLLHMIRSAFSRDERRSTDRRLAWLVVAATVPTGLIGLAGGDWFENAPLLYVGIAFLLTSFCLTLSDRFSRKSLHEASDLGWGRALLVGVAQGVAIMPGISRSGATMTAGLGLGLDREQAARFSFLLSVPIILLAGLKQSFDLVGEVDALPGVAALIVGFAASAITGYAAIAGLMSYLRRHTFRVFAAYTALVGCGVIIWQLSG